MPDEKDIEPESTYPTLERPTFSPDIPPHLLEAVSESEKWILEQLSVTKQFIAWSVEAQLSTHSAVRRTNGRLIRVENWKTKVMNISKSWWGIAIGLITVAGGIYSFLQIADWVRAHLPQ